MKNFFLKLYIFLKSSKGSSYFCLHSETSVSACLYISICWTVCVKQVWVWHCCLTSNVCIIALMHKEGFLISYISRNAAVNLWVQINISQLLCSLAQRIWMLSSLAFKSLFPGCVWYKTFLAYVFMMGAASDTTKAFALLLFVDRKQPSEPLGQFCL